jgi:hypothetical protein
MSITITFPAVEHGAGVGWLVSAALPLLGAVLVPLVENLVEDLVPGLGLALAVVKLARVQVAD